MSQDCASSHKGRRAGYARPFQSFRQEPDAPPCPWAGARRRAGGRSGPAIRKAVPEQPVRCAHGQAVEGMAQGFTNAFQPVEGADHAEHMGRIVADARQALPIFLPGTDPGQHRASCARLIPRPSACGTRSAPCCRNRSVSSNAKAYFQSIRLRRRRPADPTKRQRTA